MTGEGACFSTGAVSGEAAGGEVAGVLEAETDPGVATGAGATSLTEAEATASGVLRLDSTIATAPIATTSTTVSATIRVMITSRSMPRFAGPEEPGSGGGGGPEITGTTIYRATSPRLRYRRKPVWAGAESYGSWPSRYLLMVSIVRFRDASMESHHSQILSHCSVTPPSNHKTG